MHLHNFVKKHNYSITLRESDCYTYLRNNLPAPVATRALAAAGCTLATSSTFGGGGVPLTKMTGSSSALVPERAPEAFALAARIAALKASEQKHWKLNN